MWTKIFNKKTIYIGLFAILYLACAWVSIYHAIAFFGLANDSFMATMLAVTFEIGQAAVLFSLLTSKKDRSKVLPWVLMFIFTLVQVLGNVFSSYEYLLTHSMEMLKYFKEPIFIWTDLPDDQCNVILSYLLGGLLPITCLALTSMITNFIGDEEKEKLKDMNLSDEQIKDIEKNNDELTLLTDNKKELKNVVKQEIAKAIFEEPKKEVVEEQKDESSNETEVIDEPTDIAEEIENIEGDAELPIEEEIIENTDEDKLDYSDPIVKEVENALGDAEVPVEEDILEDNGDVNMIMNGEAIPRSAFTSETPTKKSRFVNI